MDGTDTTRALSALQAIPPDCDRDSWVKTLMAAHAAGMSLDDAIAWSESAPSFNLQDLRDVWRGIKPGQVTDATLYYLAKQNGWTDAGAHHRPSQEELALIQQRRQEQVAAAQAEIAKEQAETAAKAKVIWKEAVPATADHPYLVRKGIEPTSTLGMIDVQQAVQIVGYQPEAKGVLLQGRLLVAPIIRPGILSTVELIDEQGIKTALHGRGTKAGGYWSTDRLPETVTNVAICEGVADAITVRMAGAELAVAAFSNSNLLKVAQEMHSLFPGAVLTIVADLVKDSGRPDPHAIAAARAVGGLLAVPSFGPGREPHQKDVNDLMVVSGLEAVQQCLAGAQEVLDTEPQQTTQHQANEDGGIDAVIKWPEPTPLPNALPPVQPFDLELLPEALRGWIADISERMQCPKDFPATGAIVALSSLIGARVVVAPKAHDDWRVVPNLWGMIVGRPGVMKSPALGEVLKPLHRLEANEREVWQSAYEAWELDCKVAEMATKQNEKSAAQHAAKNPGKARELLRPVDMPEEPKARRYVVNDATVEKLGELLESNQWGTLSYRDEVHGLLCSLDRQGQEGARAFYLQSYDGNQGYTFDRIGRGTNYIPRVCLAMLGNIQPGRVESYVRDAVAGGTGDDGLLQRFGVTVWPDVSREFVHVDRWPDTPAKQRAWAVFERLNQLQPATDTDPQEWRFSDGAQALFRDWLIQFETEIRGDELHQSLVSHLAKYRKLIPALALIFALVDTPDSANVIHERELIRALAWGEYLRTHAERLYAAAVLPETTDAQTLLSKIKAGKLRDIGTAFTPRQVAVKHWAGLGTPEAVRKAADLLADYGWLLRDTVPTGTAGGRPSERYLIHPTLINGGKQ